MNKQTENPCIIVGLVSELALGGLTCYVESCASSLLATEGSCYNNDKFKFDRWTTANRVAR